MQALLMAKGSLRGCSPALPSLLLGMGVCGGKFHEYLQKLQHDAERCNSDLEEKNTVLSMHKFHLVVALSPLSIFPSPSLVMQKQLYFIISIKVSRFGFVLFWILSCNMLLLQQGARQKGPKPARGDAATWWGTWMEGWEMNVSAFLHRGKNQMSALYQISCSIPVGLSYW